ncbi:MAG: hypothetical protein ACR2GZ_07170 [Solirubrobacteraceae bacterium]
MSPATLQHHAVGVTWHETDAMARAAHAVRAGQDTWLIDPFDDPAALTAVSELGRPAGVIQLLDRHNRDCAEIAQRLGVPHHKVPTALPPESGFQAVSVVARPWWKEVALWWPDEQTLIVAEAVGTIPLFALGRPAGLHPMLRMTPPRAALGGFAPQRLLVGHGPALESGGAEALAGALSAARADVPQLLTKLPGILRAGPRAS